MSTVNGRTFTYARLFVISCSIMDRLPDYSPRFAAGVSEFRNTHDICECAVCPCDEPSPLLEAARRFFLARDEFAAHAPQLKYGFSQVGAVQRLHGRIIARVCEDHPLWQSMNRATEQNRGPHPPNFVQRTTFGEQRNLVRQGHRQGLTRLVTRASADRAGTAQRLHSKRPPCAVHVPRQRWRNIP